MTKKEILHQIKKQKFGLIEVEGDGDLVKINCGSFNIFFQLECGDDENIIEYIQTWLTLDESDEDIFHEYFDNINENELEEVFDWVIEKRGVLFNDLKKLNKCISIMEGMSLSINFIKDYIEENLELDYN
jgi:hypothetical protein